MLNDCIVIVLPVQLELSPAALLNRVNIVTAVGTRIGI